MKLGIIVNTNNPETAWNALRLGSEALAVGNEASMRKPRPITINRESGLEPSS